MEEQQTDENSALKLELKKSKAVITSMMATTTGLKKIISDQDNMIKGLLTNVKNQNTEIDKLNAVVAARGVLIAKMKKKLDMVSEQNETLNRNLNEIKTEKEKLKADKNKEIEELKKQIAELQEKSKNT